VNVFFFLARRGAAAEERGGARRRNIGKAHARSARRERAARRRQLALESIEKTIKISKYMQFFHPASAVDRLVAWAVGLWP
jgi:hypothetical protein